MRGLPSFIQNSVLLQGIGSNMKNNKDNQKGRPYPRRYHGIKNTSANCFIISIIQLLYMNLRFRSAIETLISTSSGGMSNDTTMNENTRTESHTRKESHSDSQTTSENTESTSHSTSMAATGNTESTPYMFSITKEESSSFVHQLFKIFLALDRVTKYYNPVSLEPFIHVLQPIKLFNYIPSVHMDAPEFLTRSFTVLNDYCRYTNSISPVDSEFRFDITTEVICSNGHYRSVPYSNDIVKVELRHGNLDKAWQDLSEWEVIRDYPCEQCLAEGIHEKQTIITRRVITRLGNTVLFQLGRFGVDESGKTVKFNQKFEFPITSFLEIRLGKPIEPSPTGLLDLFKSVATPTVLPSSPANATAAGSTYAEPVELSDSESSSPQELKQSRHERHRRRIDINDYELDSSSDWEAAELVPANQLNRKRLRVLSSNKVNSPSKSPVVDENHTESINSQCYQLVGILCHKGEAEHGHYTMFALEEEFSYRWVEFNDDFVQQAGLNSIPLQTFGSDTDASVRSAYLLVYKHCIPGKTSIPTYQSIVETPVFFNHSCRFLSFFSLLSRLVE